MSIQVGMLIFFVVLIFAALFVVAEFVLVRIRPSRIDYLIENGNKKAKLLKKMTNHLDRYLSATQLGVTITSLALGWLGDPTFKRLFDDLFADVNLSNQVSTILSLVISFTILTFLQVIIGELVPKNFAISKTEKIGLLIAKPLEFWYRLMFPIIFILNGTANGISRLFGLKSVNEADQAVSEEELRLIMTESLKSGEINKDEYTFVENVFKFDNRMSREIMVPRTEMKAVPLKMTLQEIAEEVAADGYTRYPVIGHDKDAVLGVINAKEIFSAYVNAIAEGHTTAYRISIKDYMHPIISVIETIPIKELLVKMQRERNQIAILVDEYGGTSGMISMEDIIEEIVGDINDDYSDVVQPEISKLGHHHYLASARISLDDINDLFGLEIDVENVDTLGGWMLNEKYDLKVGDFLSYEGYRFTVKEAGHSTLESIEIKKEKRPEIETTEKV